MNYRYGVLFMKPSTCLLKLKVTHDDLILRVNKHGKQHDSAHAIKLSSQSKESSY